MKYSDKKWYQAHPKFKKGDIVYCINITNTLKEDVPYTIDTVGYNPEDDDLCYMSIKEDSYGAEYNEHRFLTEEEYNINKSANKYNLIYEVHNVTNVKKKKMLLSLSTVILKEIIIECVKSVMIKIKKYFKI